MKTVVVTGAGGFIGGYLARYFSALEGFNVVATGREVKVELKEALSECELLEWDVLGRVPALFSADIIIHTATANDIVSREAEVGLSLSGIGTRNVLEAAIELGIPRVIIFSTFQVYGRELRGYIDERSQLCLENDYAVNHRVAELYAEMYSRTTSLHCAIVRPSNVFGRFAVPTASRWTLVPACFCKEAFSTGAICIHSSGRQCRNFVSLQNVSLGCEAIIGSNFEGCVTYNLNSSQSYSVRQVAEIVRRVYESRYDKRLEVRILSEKPQAGNDFECSQAALSSLGFSEDGSYTLETEIECLFEYLEIEERRVD